MKIFISISWYADSTATSVRVMRNSSVSQALDYISSHVYWFVWHTYQYGFINVYMLVMHMLLPLCRPLQWRHNERDGVSNHQPHDCLLNRLFRCRSKKTSNLRAIGLGAVNSPVTGEFPAQRASNAENVSIWWRHHVMGCVNGGIHYDPHFVFVCWHMTLSH